MIGAIYGNTCYPSLTLAQDAYFQSIAPIVLPSGSTISYQQILNVWNRVEVKQNGTISNTVAALPALSTCDTMQGFNDGMTVGAALVVALVSAAIYGIVARAR